MTDPAAHGLLYFRGRVGLAAILDALGLGSGDAIAIQAFTCIAVPEAVLATGATPVYIDVEEDGVTMDPDALRASLTPSTRAIVVQHTYGIPTDMVPILDAARTASIPVIEDCCHVLASSIAGQRTGSLGVAAFYSFEWGKPLVAGVGGAVLANDEDLRHRLMAGYPVFRTPPFVIEMKLWAQFHSYRVAYRPSVYWTVRSLYHTTAALGLGVPSFETSSFPATANPEYSWKISRYSRQRLSAVLPLSNVTIDAMSRIGEAYNKGVPPSVTRPRRPPAADVVLARYPLLVDDKEDLLSVARRMKVELSGWYQTPVHPVSPDGYATVAYTAGSCPNAERVSSRIVSLPVNRRVREADVDRALELFARYV